MFPRCFIVTPRTAAAEVYPAATAGAAAAAACGGSAVAAADKAAAVASAAADEDDADAAGDDEVWGGGCVGGAVWRWLSVPPWTWNVAADMPTLTLDGRRLAGPPLLATLEGKVAA